MVQDDWRRPLRGAFGNAVVWGTGWTIAALVVLTVMILAGVAAPGIGLLDAFGMAVRIGLMGALAGFVFASVILVVYRGRRLADISWVRFGIAGGVAAGLFVPLFMETMSLLTGGGLVPWSSIDTDIVVATVFGAIVAAGSLKFAQRGDALGAGDDIDQLDAADAVGVSAPPATPRAHASLRDR